MTEGESFEIRTGRDRTGCFSVKFTKGINLPKEKHKKNTGRNI
jgi:hypothetical protein